MKSMVIIGDSHVNIYTNKRIVFNKLSVKRVIHSKGGALPHLMNTIGDRGDNLIQHHIDKYKTDYIMYIFGEPDVRIHIDKQINTLNRNEDEVCHTLALKYVNKIKDITPEDTIPIIRYILPQRKWSKISSYVPIGSFEDRLRYTNKINLQLKQICLENNVLFFENYEQKNLTEEDGELKDKYCDRITHYNADSVSFLNREIEEFCKIFNTD